MSMTAQPYHEVVNEGRAQVRGFFTEHGRRPTVREMKALRDRLYRRGTSLKELCDRMGLPTWEDAAEERDRDEIRAFFAEHGRRPLEQDLPQASNRCRRRRATLAALCDEMGFSSRKESVLERGRAQVRAFFAEHGRRPSARDMRTLQGRLYFHGSSVKKVCDEAGLPERKS